MIFFLVVISGWIAFGLLAACVIGAGIHRADEAEQPAEQADDRWDVLA